MGYNGLYDYSISIPERFFKGTVHVYHRNHEPISKKIQVSYAIPVTKIFASVFEITDIMPMPDNTQRIGFIKSYPDFCFAFEFMFP